MTRRISLALAIHNHQPVGNFGWVFDEVFGQAYEPMVDALERHPGVRLSLHYTGPLLEWFRTERPEFVARLRALVERGQVEIIGGGYFEPVLASLPERDRIGQLRRMADELTATFGARPRGAWLAERVWEPDIPTSLVAAGYAWTILDDAHFRAAAIPEEALWGPYTTEDQGNLLTVFGTEQGLRYRIPFREVDEVIAYLREHATEAGDRLGTMGDDGEKFGAWPTTFEHCWGKGKWVERFFSALETNADWLTTVTPSDWLSRRAPIGRVYVPTGSYAEMGEWALPADEGAAFKQVLHDAQAAKKPEARWLRGAFWRNFQVKYREINDLHKQMLRTSSKVARMADGPSKAAALDHLYRGQSNDCYWHGLFGGIYISHMRLATAEHLIAAEDLADAALGSTSVAELTDLDLDGVDEVLLADSGQVVAVDLSEGGGVGEWDVRAVRHALTSVMRRRPEAYHELLRTAAASTAEGTPAAFGDGSAPASIHDRILMKEPDLVSKLVYDDHERRSGLVRILTADGATEVGDFVDGAFEIVRLVPGELVMRRERSGLLIEKTIRLRGDRLSPRLELEVGVTNTASTVFDGRLVLESTMTMLGGGGNPSAWWRVGGTAGAHDGSGHADEVDRVAQGNDYIGIAVETTISPPGAVSWTPIETISNSEAGFERVYQGSELLVAWSVRLAPGAGFTASLFNEIHAARDCAAEEAQMVMTSR
jgi:4-alpha-glucanotransferase